MRTAFYDRNRGNQSQELRPEHAPEVRLTDALNLCRVFICTSVLAHARCAFVARHQKLISRSKKELENFIRAKFKDYNPERASQKALRTVPPIRSQHMVYISFFETAGCTLNEVLLAVYIIHI